MRNVIWILLLFITTSFNTKKVEFKSNYEFEYKPLVIEKKKVQPMFHTWDIPKNKQDWKTRDWLAKMLYSEIADTTQTEALYFIGATALNNSKIINKSIIQTITKPGSYSGVNKNWWGWNNEPTDTHKQIAWDLLTKGVKKKHKKAYAFCACESSIVAESTRQWFYKLPLHKRIGSITFYNYPYEQI